jgi:hypothetical protein
MTVNYLWRVEGCELAGKGRRQNQLGMIDDCEPPGDGR